MFSYRHAFHAGNHADVLKHLVLLAVLRHLTQKDAALTAIDTHAGAGMYKLDSDHARTSGESLEGVVKLMQHAIFEPNDSGVAVFWASDATKKEASGRAQAPAALADYLQLLAQLNPGSRLRAYPGSPFVMHHALRPHDRIVLCEIHPTDSAALAKQVDAHAGMGAGFTLRREDGFATLPKLLPPPPSDARGSRRAIALIDPSYELKTDYAATHKAVAAALQKFPTGCLCVWYPIIARPEAHQLPRKLASLASAAGKPVLHATLSVGRAEKTGPGDKAPLSASGMVVINPPHTLREQLNAALPLVRDALALGRGAAFSVA